MPGMMKKPMPYQKGGPVFEPCAKCPSPAKCMMKAKK